MANITSITEALEKAKESLRQKDASILYTRQTFYLTYEEIAAIKRIAGEEGVKKSDLLRVLVDSALNELRPGILDNPEVKAEAEKERIEWMKEISKKSAAYMETVSKKP